MALNAKTIAAGVGDILNVDGGLTGSLKQVVDGDGTGSTISLSTSIVSVSGNVGIGTTGPSIPLVVEDANAGTNPVAQFKNTGSNEDASILFTNDAQNIIIGIDGSDSDKFKISDNTAHGTNDRVTMDTSGNIGIGTSAPAVPLHVYQS